MSRELLKPGFWSLWLIAPLPLAQNHRKRVPGPPPSLDVPRGGLSLGCVSADVPDECSCLCARRPAHALGEFGSCVGTKGSKQWGSCHKCFHRLRARPGPLDSGAPGSCHRPAQHALCRLKSRGVTRRLPTTLLCVWH